MPAAASTILVNVCLLDEKKTLWQVRRRERGAVLSKISISRRAAFSLGFHTMSEGVRSAAY